MLLEQLMNGLGQGAIYALMSIGYALIFGVVGLVTFVHGDVIMLGAFTAYAGKTLERPHHYFCSEFVAECLAESGAAVLPNPPGLSHPIDFTTIEGEKLLFEGEIGQLARQVAAPTAVL